MREKRFSKSPHGAILAASLLLATAWAGPALAGGGGNPAPPQDPGDNPHYEAGSMSGKITKDCTNFSVTSAGVLSAECNASTDTSVPRSSTTIDLSGNLTIGSNGASQADYEDTSTSPPTYWTVYKPRHLSIRWSNGDNPFSHWDVSFGSACTDAGVAYVTSTLGTEIIYLDANCSLNDICVGRNGSIPPASCASDVTSKSSSTNMHRPNDGGGLRNNNGQLELK